MARAGAAPEALHRNLAYTMRAPSFLAQPDVLGEQPLLFLSAKHHLAYHTSHAFMSQTPFGCRLACRPQKAVP